MQHRALSRTYQEETLVEHLTLLGRKLLQMGRINEWLWLRFNHSLGWLDTVGEQALVQAKAQTIELLSELEKVFVAVERLGAALLLLFKSHSLGHCLAVEWV